MGFFQNTCKPQGLGGKIMVNMMNSGHMAMAEWGFQHIEVLRSDCALDIGCGGGANVKKLLQLSDHGSICGIDYSEISVEKSRRLNSDAIKEGRCRIIQGNVMELPFPDMYFNVVTAFETIYFWPDLVNAFKQVYRVLTNDGFFMICNECGSEKPKNEKWVNMIDGMRIYSSVQLQDFLRQAGFTDIETDKNGKGWICLIVRKN